MRILLLALSVLFATFGEAVSKPDLKIGEVQTTSGDAWSDVVNAGDGI